MIASESEFIPIIVYSSSSCSSDEEETKLTERQDRYKCTAENCNQRFKRNTYLDRHIYQCHSKIKKYACEIEGCDKRYIISTHLKRHIRTFHEKKHEGRVSRFKCTVLGCERFFNTQTNVNRHIRQYHENPKVHKCTECEFTTRHKVHFARHMARHSKTDEQNKSKPNTKQYNCENCQTKFAKWSELLNHRREAHRPTCEICGRKFTQRKNLKAHINSHIKKEENVQFHCPHDGCRRSYMHRRNLNVHVKVAHEGIRFSCRSENCDKTFTTKQNLEEHLQLHGAKDIVVERKPQSVRKDKGIKKNSAISLLAGINLDAGTNELLMLRKGEDLKVDYSSFVTTSDSDGERVLVPRRLHVQIKEEVE